MKKRKLYIGLLFIFIVVLLAGSITFSWIKRRWTPTIYEDNIRIESSGSLMLKFGDDLSMGEQLSKILNLQSDLILRPVSSISGEGDDFFVTKTEDKEGEKKIYFSHVSEDLVGKGYVEQSYVDLEFQIVSGPESSSLGTQYIFLHPDSIITYADDAEKKNGYLATRVAISFNNEKPIIFVSDDNLNGVGLRKTASNPDGKLTQQTGITNAKHNGNSIADGTYYYRYSEEGTILGRSTKCKGYENDLNEGSNLSTKFSYVGEYTGSGTPTDLYSLSSKNGGYENTSEEYFDAVDGTPIVSKLDRNKCLYPLNPDSSAYVHVRIWLEGEDELCTAQYSAGDAVKIKLKFDSVRVTSVDTGTTD